MAGQIVEVGDRTVDGDEPLEAPGGFGPFRDPLSPPRPQVRILRPVAETLIISHRNSGRECQAAHNLRQTRPK